MCWGPGLCPTRLQSGHACLPKEPQRASPTPIPGCCAQAPLGTGDLKEKQFQRGSIQLEGEPGEGVLEPLGPCSLPHAPASTSVRVQLRGGLFQTHEVLQVGSPSPFSGSYCRMCFSKMRVKTHEEGVMGSENMATNTGRSQGQRVPPVWGNGPGSLHHSGPHQANSTPTPGTQQSTKQSAPS